MIGLGKGGLPGAGNLTIALFAAVFGPKPSVAILLPVLICGDLVAITVYRRHAEWRILGRLLPSTLVGVFLGWVLFEQIPADTFRYVIGAMLLVMTALHFIRRAVLARRGGGDDAVPHTWWFVNGTGLAGGLASMLANAAGPVAAFYLMAARLPKYAFIGTSAWFFFAVNLSKVPMQAQMGYLRWGTLPISLSLGVLAMLGALLAPHLVRFIPQKLFETAIWVLIILAGINFLI